MCGRFVRSFTNQELIQELGLFIEVTDSAPTSVEPNNFNVAPTTLITAATCRDERASLELMRWGFTMRGRNVIDDSRAASRTHTPVINARIETVTEKPMFRRLIDQHRCVVPMSGFYEWKRDGNRKTPFYISRHDGQTMWVAGLWRHESFDDQEHVALLTMESDVNIAHIHNRVPVQLSLNDAVEWMTTHEPTDALIHMATHENSPQLRTWTVSTAVNSIRNNSPSLIVQSDSQESPSLFDDLP